MRKVTIVIGLCLLALASLAMAEEGQPTPTLRAVPAGVNVPSVADRDGDCTLGLLDPADIAYAWDWDGGYRQYKLYVDPTTDVFDGTCTPPYFPLTINSVDLLLYSLGDSINLDGQTVTLVVDIECPANVGTSYPDKCNGPGDIICSYVVSHTYTPEEASGLDFLLVNVPFAYPHCLDTGFFVGVRIVGWTGADINDAPAPLSGGAPTPDPATMTCKVWWYNAQAFGSFVSPPCWQEIVTTYVTPWGPWSMYVNVTTGAACTPVVCNPCDSGLPGETVEDPFIVAGTNASYIVNLCDYCPNYDQRDAFPGGGFTAQGGDVVFEMAFDPSLTEVCFTITLEPLCADPSVFFRIRSWLTDSYGTLYAGTPTFPTFGGSQTYDFTAAGLGCLPPDVYHLYVDARGCCCPVRVTYEGDETLPVELTSFTAVPGDEEVTLSWRTASERNVEFYEVVRNNETLTRIHGLGDSPSGHVYNYMDRDVVNGTEYRYQIRSIDVGGAVTLHETVASATPRSDVVTEYALFQNYPNPFNPTTQISFDLLESGFVSLKVYNLMGQDVATLVSGTLTAGHQAIGFDARDLPSGIYIYKLETGDFSATRKMVLMK